MGNVIESIGSLGLWQHVLLSLANFEPDWKRRERRRRGRPTTPFNSHGRMTGDFIRGPSPTSLHQIAFQMTESVEPGSKVAALMGNVVGVEL